VYRSLAKQGQGWLEHSRLGGQESLKKFYQEFIAAPPHPSSHLGGPPFADGHAGEPSFQHPDHEGPPEEEELLSGDLLADCGQLRLTTGSGSNEASMWKLASEQPSVSGVLVGPPESTAALGQRPYPNCQSSAVHSAMSAISGSTAGGSSTYLAFPTQAPGSGPAAQQDCAASLLLQLPQTTTHHRSVSIDGSAISAAPSERKSGASGCLAELELLADVSTEEMVTEGQLAASGGSGGRSLSDMFADVAASSYAQLLLGDGALQGAALLREPDLADQEGGVSPQRGGHRMDFADVGSPPLEEDAPADNGSLVYDLDRPAATPFLRLPNSAAMDVDERVGTAGSLEGEVLDAAAWTALEAGPSGGQQEDSVSQPAVGACHQRPSSEECMHAPPAEGGGAAPSTGMPPQQGGNGVQVSAPEDGRLKLPALKTASGAGADGDMGHLRIRAFRPPRSPSGEPPPQLQMALRPAIDREVHPAGSLAAPPGTPPISGKSLSKRTGQAGRSAANGRQSPVRSHLPG
jgi:hypothetical protein